MAAVRGGGGGAGPAWPGPRPGPAEALPGTGPRVPHRPPMRETSRRSWPVRAGSCTRWLVCGTAGGRTPRRRLPSVRSWATWLTMTSWLQWAHLAGGADEGEEREERRGLDVAHDGAVGRGGRRVRVEAAVGPFGGQPACWAAGHATMWGVQVAGSCPPPCAARTFEAAVSRRPASHLGWCGSRSTSLRARCIAWEGL